MRTCNSQNWVIEAATNKLDVSSRMLEEKVETRSQELIETQEPVEPQITVVHGAEETLWENQYFLQRLREITPSSAYIYDLNAQRSIYVNCQMAQMLGYTLLEIEQTEMGCLPSLLHPDDAQPVTEHYKRFQNASDSEILHIEYRLRHKNGEWRWLESQETIFARDSEGLPYQILGVVKDMTERKQLEESLLDSEQRFRAIFDRTVQLTWVLKTDGTLLEANQTALDFSGQKRSDVVNRPFWEARWWTQPDGEMGRWGDKELFNPAQRTSSHPHSPYGGYSPLSHSPSSCLSAKQEQLKRAIAAACQGEVVRYEVEVGEALGVAIALDFSIEPFIDETGEVVLLIAQGRVIGDSLPYALRASYANGFSCGVQNSFASRQQVEAVLAEQNHILEMIAKGEPLHDVLSTIAQLIETQSPHCLCSFLLLDKNGVTLRYGAAPSLPDAYNQALDGMTIGPYAASCGTAAYWGEAVIVEDIENHPVWADFRDLALSYGLRACWSRPICSTQGKVLGTIAIYYREPHTPDRYEQELTAKATQLARIAIERSCTQEELLRSNAMLKAQQEAAIDGIVVIDENRQIASYNQRFCQLWQIPHQLVESGDEGRLLNELLSQIEDAQAFLAKAENLYAHPTETSYDEFTLKDGRIFEFYSAPVLSPSGGYYGRIWYNRDITERKQAEAALRQTEEKYRLLVESAGDAIIAVDAETGIILEANQMAEKILGRLRREIIGLHQTEIQPPERRERFTTLFQKHVEAGGVLQTEVKLCHKDGTIVPVEVSATVVDVQGKKIVQGIFRDIRDRKQTEKILKQAKVAAEAANHAKSEFLANMSHELRTPLNGILGYAQILKREPNLNPAQQEQLGIIQQCGEHLLTLLNDILDLSKIEAQKMELYLSDFQFPHFLESIVEIVRINAEQKNIFFHFETLSELPEIVRGDERRLRQVLINLLGNAVKFTDQGGVTFKVGYVTGNGEMARWRDGDNSQFPISNSQFPTQKMRFIIEDTGIGMPSEQLSDIFLPFHQIGEPSRRVEGTGLGLAISQKLVQLMGGELHVKSHLAQGSVFALDVDLPTVLEEAEVVEHPEVSLIKLKEKYKVLVVDDKWENRSVLRDLLSPLGFIVAQAVDGQDCLEQALQLKPDVILLDMRMPRMDGFEVLKRLRQLPTLEQVIVIAMSASAFDYDRQKCLAAGCNGFISKPVQVEKLLDQLCRHLGLDLVNDKKDEKIPQKNESKHSLKTGLRPATLTDSTLVTSIVAPPREELTALYELAMMGDIRGIQQQAKKLEQLNDKFVPFAKQLCQLAKGFQEKQILEFVRKCMAENG